MKNIIVLFSAVLLFPLMLYSQNSSLPDTILHTSEIVDINFTCGKFQICGSLYLPEIKKEKYPALIWVSGSGPSFRKIKSKETIKLVNIILDKKFAYFRIDKPGSGDSAGKLDNDSLFAQLSDIVVSAVKKLAALPQIDNSRIGLFGSSQAGYIMPLAAVKCSDIDFIIGSSCPGENSIEQWNYLLEKQMICEGIPPSVAGKNIEMFSVLRNSQDKKAFDAAISYFKENPIIVRSLGYDSLFYRRAASWWPREINPGDESHFNPVSVLDRVSVPVFMIYGKKDKQIDPIQAVEAYSDAFTKNGNIKSHIRILENSDHNMSLSSGCLGDIEMLNKKGEYKYDPEYLSTLSAWLDEILTLQL